MWEHGHLGRRTRETGSVQDMGKEKVKWIGRRRKDKALDILSDERQLLDRVQRRQEAWIRRVLSWERMLKTVLEDRMLGKQLREWKIIGILDRIEG